MTEDTTDSGSEPESSAPADTVETATRRRDRERQPMPPFASEELQYALRRPPRQLEVVLAERRRLVANVADRHHLLDLSMVLLSCSVLFALPFGAVLRPSAFWNVALLFLGSIAICFPSLQVFSAYLGVRISVAQNLVLALLIPSAAGLFCFGFFPILWFLDVTMAADADITARHISIALLAVSLLAGLGHLNRCLFLDRALRQLRSSSLLLLCWQLLVVFITFRMATVLGLL